MRVFLLLLIVIAASGSPAAAQTGAAKSAAKAIALHTDVTIKGGLVRLGDIFRNTGIKAKIAIAYAPAPGRQAVLDASWLSETADRHGLDVVGHNILADARQRRGRSQLDFVLAGFRRGGGSAREAVIGSASRDFKRIALDAQR